MEAMKLHHSVSSKALGTMSCPVCGRVGQLKRRTTGYGLNYFQVDHWKKGNCHKSGYDHSCYLGVEVKKETKQ